MSISVVISFCTNDFRYLSYCVEGVRPFAKEILIVVSSHFFDGEEENRELLHRAYAEFADCTFIEYQFDEENPYGRNPPAKECAVERLHHWHSTSRYIGWHFAKKNSEYLLFLDVDEIVEGKKMDEWLQTGHYLKFDCLHFFAYRYHELPSIRGERYGNTALLVKRDKISGEELFHRFERAGFFRSFSGKKMSGILGGDGFPMIHHYSWVKTESEFLKKIRSWGHKHDVDWTLASKSYKFGFERDIQVYPFCNPLALNVDDLCTREHYRYIAKESFRNLTVVDPVKIKKISVTDLI